MAEEAMTRRVCPLVAAGWAATKTRATKEDAAFQCLAEDCAWYNVLRKACAVPMIAVDLRGIRQALGKR